MKLLTICTRRYTQQLEDFTACATAGGLITTPKTGREGGLFFAVCRYDHSQAAFPKGLMTLLADIAVQENPVYLHSPKLQCMANDLHKTSLFDTGLKNLTRFLKHNRLLHLEGYVAFRMADYREKLDMMSYTLIKKLKLNQKD